MDPLAVQAMIAAESAHPWYRARLFFVENALSSFETKDVKILDFGCGSGAALDVCKRLGFAQTLGLDVSDDCVESTKRRGIRAEKIGLEFPEVKEDFDFVICLDVLEHLQDDINYLSKLKDMLKENGRILVSVPAHQFLWSSHDDLNHHFRRYSRKSFMRLVNESQLKIVEIRYWNSLLFPLFVFSRILSRFSRRSISSEFNVPPKFLSEILFFILRQEVKHKFFGRLVGLSIVATLSPKEEKRSIY
jgi:2-polyprenyl-3-methyl-5-hydroxy-6-metoxy-1,4-benzoquinol methylase